jgi:hypothetical protein
MKTPTEEILPLAFKRVLKCFSHNEIIPIEISPLIEILKTNEIPIENPF